MFEKVHLFDCRRKRTNEGGGAGKTTEIGFYMFMICAASKCPIRYFHSNLSCLLSV